MRRTAAAILAASALTFGGTGLVHAEIESTVPVTATTSIGSPVAGTGSLDSGSVLLGSSTDEQGGSVSHPAPGSLASWILTQLSNAMFPPNPCGPSCMG